MPTLYNGGEGNIDRGAIASPWRILRGRKTPCMCGIFMRENRERLWFPTADGAAGRIGKA